MKKTYLLFFIAYFLCFIAHAQKAEVFLKNGSVIKGKVSYSPDLNKLKVESSGNTWVFQQSEVERVEHNSIKYEVGDRVSRFFGKAELGVAIGNSENSKSAPFTFSSALNYYLTNSISVGGGLGVEFLEESYLPAFAVVEYQFRGPESSPFLFFKTGYMVPLDKNSSYHQDGYTNSYEPWSSFYIPPSPLETQGGLFVNPGFGYMRMFGNGFGMSLAFGYQFHKLNYFGENDYELTVDSNRLTLKIGFVFQ